MNIIFVWGYFMAIIERDYMGESSESRELAYKKKLEREKRNKLLWDLYAKKNKTIFDKLKIRKIEKENLRDAN